MNDDPVKTLTIELSGRIDSGNSAAVEKDVFEKLEGKDITSLILDASGLEYISSAGLRVILHIRKQYEDLRITDVNNEVYDIFEMTGFTEMMPIEKAYRKVSVEGCEEIGKGAKGTIYRIDKDNVVKVYNNPEALEDIQHEREVAKLALVLGIPTAISYDVVKVGDAGTTTFKGPAAQSDRYGFKRFETGVMDLSAGTSYRLEVSIEQKNNSDKNKSMNFDVFRMEKVEIADVVGRFTKTGGGTLRTDAWTGADVQVGAGILNIESAAISNTIISVQGGTLELVDARMDEGSQIGVSAGGALAFSPIGRKDLISNGSFEVDGPQTNIVVMNPTGWTVGQTKTTDNNKNGSGLQGNGGNVTPSGPSTAARTVTVYLREYSTLSQTVSVTDAGKYRLSFSKACRTQFYSYSIPVTVTVDGVTVFESTNNSTSEFERFSADVYLDAADHTVTFTTGAPSTSANGSMVFIDDIRLNPFKSQSEIDAGTIDMASGSTLRLDNIEKVVIKDFRVDGMPIRGGRAVAEAAGVAVSGSGTVRFGDKPGLTVFVR